MKKLFRICSLVVMLVGLTAFNAAALPMMNGDISFSGNDTINAADLAAATAFTSFSAVKVSTASGTFANVTPNITTATFNVFNWATPVNVNPLWSFTDNNMITFSLYALGSTMTHTAVAIFNGVESINISGTGTIQASSGFESTPGAYVITANEAGQTFSFSGSSATIPEPGTLFLLGLGLVGLAGIRRKFKS